MSTPGFWDILRRLLPPNAPLVSVETPEGKTISITYTEDGKFKIASTNASDLPHEALLPGDARKKVTP